MSLLAGAAGAVWRFVVGEDWRIALGVALTIGIVALLGGLSLNAWWAMPPAVVALLGWSVRRA